MNIVGKINRRKSKEKTMRILVVLGMILAILLSACAQQSPVATTASSPTEKQATKVVIPETTAAVETTAVMSELPAEPSAAETSAATTDSPVSEGMVVYKIVPGESKATYEVGETFFRENNRFNLAVGITPQVSGEIRLDPTHPQSAEIGEIKVDVSQLQSDSSRRDGMIQRRFLESSAYPTTVFKPTKIEGLPESYTEGQELSFKVSGELTVKETNKPISFEVTAKLEKDTLSGVATTTILLSDFGVGPISLAGMLETEDQAKLSLNFVARP
jgi:polyisoprenoid-binding protein YceI